MQSVSERRQKWARELFWRGWFQAGHPQHKAVLCFRVSCLESASCCRGEPLQLCRGAITQPCCGTSAAVPLQGADIWVLLVTGLLHRPPGNTSPGPSLGSVCHPGHCGSFKTCVGERGIHFSAPQLDILWWLLRGGRGFCSSVAFLWDR